MSFSTGRTLLVSAHKDLRRLWDETRAGWNDPVSQQFEEHHWEPLDKQVADTVREIDRLTEVQHRLRQQCS